MKILHLSSEKTWRGGEQQIAYLILESLLKGIQTHVICRKGTEFETWCKKNNIQHLSVSFANELDLISVFKIKKYCVTHRIDIMHAHSSHSHALGLFSKLFGNPAHFIVSRRVDFPIRDNWFSRYKFNHSSVLKYVCVSKAIEIILSKDLLEPEKSVTIHSGIDTQKFKGVINQHTLRKEFNIPENKKIVGNVSAIAPHKDLKTFVIAAKEVLKQSKDFHFFIIGEGNMRASIEHLIESENLTENITLTGFRTDIPQILKELDFFMMSSETEGLGTTLLDASANEVPIVSTAAGGIPEFVEHEVTGLLAKVGDYKQLAENLIRLSSNPVLAKELTKNALAKLNSGFTKEITATKTIELYGKIIATNTR